MPGEGTRFRAKTKSLYAAKKVEDPATKIQYSQINIKKIDNHLDVGEWRELDIKT